MDPEQFNKLLDVFNRSQEELLKRVQATFEGNINVLPITSNIVPFENFDSSKELFTCYLERFENYSSLKNVNDDKRSQLLCTSIGSLHYNNLSAFLGPGKHIKQLTYDNLVKVLKQMLCPSRSVIVSQHYFLNIVQGENQSITEFVSNLRRNIFECDFNIKCECNKTVSVVDVFMRVQFIRGLRDNSIREQILMADLSSFDEILKKATALEASHIDCKNLTKSSRLLLEDTFSHTTNNLSKSESLVSRPYSSNKSRSSPPQRTPNQRHRQYSQSRNRRDQVDFKTLGIDGLCFSCAKSNHKSKDCRIDRDLLHCKSCGRRGHVAKVCITTLMGNTETSSIRENTIKTYSDNESESEYGVFEINSANKEIVDLYEFNHFSDKYYVTVMLNGRPQQFEVDSGAKYSLLSESEFYFLDLDVPLEPTNIYFRSYSDHIIKPRGKVNLTVEYKGGNMETELFIVPNGHDALLGRMWIRGLGIELKDIDKDYRPIIHRVVSNPVNSVEDIFNTFSYIFEEIIGCVPNVKIKLNLRPGTKPVYTRERQVPFALRNKVDEELTSLESLGVISPVSSSDWGSPLVVIPKPDGGVRLCVDYKCGVNERIVSVNHPIRKIEEVLHSLKNSRYFCKLDLYKAYLHLQVDEESSYIQTITTHKGTFKMNRLSFGIKTAPAEFNRVLEQILRGLVNTEAYFDDIIVHGATLDECTRNLTACLKRLTEHDLHLNKNKCSFFKEKINYLGHVIEFNKISKSPDKVRAIMDMPHPKNIEELRRFLGLVTFYAKFIQNFSTKTYHLRRLLHKNQKYIWTSTCENAFMDLKAELCSESVLTPYDSTLPLTLTTDASPFGVSAVLSHTIDGFEKPIAYASRSLTQAEANYSQLDREALAIIFAISHFYNYIFGRNFVLYTDNAPLSRIFHQNRALPRMTSSRLLRYASFLSGFDYTIKLKKSEDNKIADCLSRAPVPDVLPVHKINIDVEVDQLYDDSIFQLSSEAITFKTIANETAKDHELCDIMKRLQNQPTDEPYTIFNGVLFRQDRIVVPKNLQQQILKELHFTHLGIVKMKQLARRYVYWPKIDSDIENLVKSCENCAKTQTNPPKAQIHPWEEPNENWERLHIDFAGPVDSQYLLICIDAKSKWPEVRILRDAPSTASTISLLEDIFSTHGYPAVLVSDNASIFTSDSFRKYATDRGIFQKLIAPGHPATNGLAERNVQTLKRRLNAASNNPGSLYEKLRAILLRCRATPLANGNSPAELYLQRKIRIRLDAIKPHPECLKRPIKLKKSKKVRTFTVGERVQARVHYHNKDIWQFGVIDKQLGDLHYNVVLDSGRNLKRHLDQLRSTLVPRKTVTFTTGITDARSPIQGIPNLPPMDPDSEQASPQIVREREPETQMRPQRNRRPPPYLQDYVV